MPQPKTERNEPTSLSFLDVIACAFGAIVILVLILPIGRQTVSEAEPLSVASMGRILFLIDETREEISSLQSQIESSETLLGSIQAESASISDATKLISNAVTDTMAQTADVEAQRSALATTRSILENIQPKGPSTEQVDTELAGIPVDSEYLAFVIDTSGSMQTIWNVVLKEIERFWLLYPEIKGFQVMNDNGSYLYRHTKGRWIPDSASARKRALRRTRIWLGFSNSSPVEGIIQAVDDLCRDGIKMAIVVVGDDYQGASFQGVLDQVDRKVQSRSIKEGELRIHAIGFWNQASVAAPESFGVLMRELTQRNDGAFVALEARNSNPLPIPFLR